MDNARIHKVERVLSFLDAIGVVVRFLPAYSPTMNAIEECFAHMKRQLRETDELQAIPMESAVRLACLSLPRTHMPGYFRHAGYDV